MYEFTPSSEAPTDAIRSLVVRYIHCADGADSGVDGFLPIRLLIRYSFLDFSMLLPDVAPVSVGWADYIDLLTDRDVWQRFAFTGKFVLATLSIQFVVGIAAAHGFQRDFRGRDLLFTLALMPMMFCPIVVGFLWQYMFNSEWGMVNWLISLLGIAEIELAR